MDLKDLYGRKGQLITQLELMQNELNEINKAIVAEFQKEKAAIPRREEAKQ